MVLTITHVETCAALKKETRANRYPRLEREFFFVVLILSHKLQAVV